MSENQGRTSDINGRKSSDRNHGAAKDESKATKVKLDVEKLHSLPSEQQDLYLFTFAVELQNYVESLNFDDLSSKQEALNVQFLKVLSLSSPAPSKAIRSQLGRSYSRVLGKGNRRTLFDTVNKLVAFITTSKGEKDLENKHAAAYCLGEIYKAAGDSAINLSSLVCTTLIRLLKSSQSHAGLRAAIFSALSKIAESVQGSLDESIARDIWKQGRIVASSDKAALVQAKACSCLEQLMKRTKYFDSVNDFENLKATVWKASETLAAQTRHAAASCLAAALIKSYTEVAVAKSTPKAKRPKKVQRPQSAALEEVGQEIDRSESPSNSKKSPIKLELSLQEILQQLSSQYLRSNTTNKSRTTITHCYVKILQGLDVSIVESSYSLIVEHLLTEILSNPSMAHDRHRLLMTRRLVNRILSDCIGSKIFGESGRLTAARIIINTVLKNYPQVLKEIPEPSKQALVGALDALVWLIDSLGSAFRPLAENCREALLQVLQHPSYTIQIHAAYCLRTFVLVCPQQLLSCASICMNCLTRELGLLGGPKQSPRRCIGYANGLASILSISPSQPLYSSLEICSRVLGIATDLLKSSSQADLRLAGVQVQVAWILIGGLMALGPAFVKIHISQFLLLWRNALPKPLTRENTAQRSSAEIRYLTQVRESTLGSILLFLDFNSRLITVDVAKRIASMLQNTLEYLDNISGRKNLEDVAQRIVSSLSMQDLILMNRRRVLQCYARLLTSAPAAKNDILTQSNLIVAAVGLFADPEAYSPGTLGSSIANAAGTFDTIWDVSDNSGFGMTGFIRGLRILPLPGEHRFSSTQNRISEKDESSAIDDIVGLRYPSLIRCSCLQLTSPIIGAQEHDSVFLHRRVEVEGSRLPDPPATEVVNSAIAVFASALPLQSPKVQEGVLEQLATFLVSPSLYKNPGRRAAVMINTATALLGALKVTGGETVAEHGDLKYSTVERTIEEMIRVS